MNRRPASSRWSQKLGVLSPFDPFDTLVTSPVFSPLRARNPTIVIRILHAFHARFYLCLGWDTDTHRWHVRIYRHIVVRQRLTRCNICCCQPPFVFHRSLLHRSVCILLGCRRAVPVLRPEERKELPAAEMASTTAVIAPPPVLHDHFISCVSIPLSGYPRIIDIHFHATFLLAAILVTIVYWAVLSSSSTFSSAFSGTESC